MISSEVQRTLVKSPPELWTELSDPDSLARHLGELGEISITRMKPEELVEWQAEGTTGTVAIKPSGWGTKVTLTVNRELPAAPAAEDPTTEEGTAAEPTAEEGAITEEGTAAEPTAESGPPAESSEPPVEQSRGQDAVVAPVEPIAEVADSDRSDTEALESQPTAAFEQESARTDESPEPTGPTPGPATEAARRAAGWLAPRDHAGPAIESDLRAAEDAAGDLTGELPVAITLSATDLGSEPSDETVEPAASDDPASSRRGFFARLFGGRRRKASAQIEPPIEPPTLAAELSALGAKAEDSSFADQDAEDSSLAPEDLEAMPSEAPVDDAEAILPEAFPPPMPQVEVAVPEPAAAEPSFEDLTDAYAEEPDVELATGAPEHEPAVTPDVVGGESPEAPSEPQDGAQQATSEDLAAELKAAEETAAEEVKAVLTGMLDRLGAAHHRPFSRS
jgi:hypothetical protein